jgi:DNA-binding MarR family transcriptional regulator
MTTAQSASAQSASVQRPDYVALGNMFAAIHALTAASSNPELPAQTMSFYLMVAARHPTEVPYGELEAKLGLSQASISRNAAYLSRGHPSKGTKGSGLIEVYEDPYYVKRKLCRLTPKGVTVAQQVAKLIRNEEA